jgi:hypothetical protein
MKNLSSYRQFNQPISESQKMAGDLFIGANEGADMINDFLGELNSDPEVLAALQQAREVIRKKMSEDPAISLLGDIHFEEHHDRTREYWSEDPPRDLNDLSAGWLFVQSTVLGIGE